MKKMILNSKYDRDVIIYAFRYALGRASYAPGLMQEKLDEIWNQLERHDQDMILSEIAEREKTNLPMEGWGLWRQRKENERQRSVKDNVTE